LGTGDYYERPPKDVFRTILYKHLYNTVSDKKIPFGMGFKKDTNDTRESAAIYVADDLINESTNCGLIPKCRQKKVLLIWII
jgi:UDPglucose 6-dehydrogenase